MRQSRHSSSHSADLTQLYAYSSSQVTVSFVSGMAYSPAIGSPQMEVEVVVSCRVHGSVDDHLEITRVDNTIFVMVSDRTLSWNWSLSPFHITSSPPWKPLLTRTLSYNLLLNQPSFGARLNGIYSKIWECGSSSSTLKLQ